MEGDTRMSISARIPAVLAVMAMAVNTGCVATSGQLRRGLEQEASARAQQERELQAAIEAERQERLASDQSLAAELGALNTDLALLRDDHGVRIALLEDGLEFAVPVHFAFDSSEVEQQNRESLQKFAEFVQRHYGGAMITVEGFADPAGSAAYNKALSQRRADAVKATLVSMGLPEGQVRAVGYGEERQVVAGAAGRAEGAELNRRVVFVVETPQVASVIIGSRE
jgi:peptidoglycan-associated lipoprotein